MKKLFIIVLIFVSMLKVYSQSADNDCYKSWDWEDPDSWFIYFNNTDSIKKYPFNQASMTGAFRSIYNNQDMSKEAGWVFLQKDFGCFGNPTNNPYVVFYNRYRGIIRYIGYNSNAVSSNGVLIVEWGGSQSSAELTYSNTYSKANDKYPGSHNDQTLLHIAEFGYNQWFTTEFQVAFDHNTLQTQAGRYLNFRVHNVTSSNLNTTGSVNLVSQSMEIKGTKPGNVNNNVQEWLVKGQKAIQKTDYDNWKNHVNSVKTALDETSDWAQEKYGKTTNEIFSWASSKSCDLYEVLSTDKFSDILRKGVKSVEILDKTLGVAIDMFNFFVGKPTSPTLVQLAPLQTTGTISTSGTLKTSTQNTNITMTLPGTQNDYPYYNCALGVMNLEQTPQVDLRRWTMPKRYPYAVTQHNLYVRKSWSESTQLYTKSYSCSSLNHRETESVYLVEKMLAKQKDEEKWKSVRLKEDIKLAVNSASGMEVVSVKVALQGKVKANSEGLPSYNLFENSEYFPNDLYEKTLFLTNSAFANPQSSICYRDSEGNNKIRGNKITPIQLKAMNDRWTNYVFEKLANKEYYLVEGDKNQNDFYKFRTGFVDIERAKNLSITVRDETEITLKIMIILKEAGNDDAPLMVLTNEYIIDEPEFENDAIDTSYPLSSLQTPDVDTYQGSNKYLRIAGTTISSGLHTAGKIETEGKVIANANAQSIYFVASDKIVLKPGFEAKASNNKAVVFAWGSDSDITIPPHTPKAQLIKYYHNGVASSVPQSCNCFPANMNSAKAFEEFETEMQIQETLCEVSPNPCQNYINIFYNDSVQKNALLTIYNINGHVEMQQNILSGGDIKIDVSGLSSGMYIIRIVNGEKTINKKIIKM